MTCYLKQHIRPSGDCERATFLGFCGYCSQLTHTITNIRSTPRSAAVWFPKKKKKWISKGCILNSAVMIPPKIAIKSKDFNLLMVWSYQTFSMYVSEATRNSLSNATGGITILIKIHIKGTPRIGHDPGSIGRKTGSQDTQFNFRRDLFQGSSFKFQLVHFLFK